MAKKSDVTFIIKCVVKGYHACQFSVENGEAFVARRKGGERAVETLLKLSIGVQAELVSPLWPLYAEIDVLTLPLFSITLFLIAFKSH